jgi:predicted DNA-binding transcriptional regulator AlpA
MTTQSNTAAAENTGATDSPGPRPLLTAPQAAERLGVPASILERWRGTGEGPAYIKLSGKYVRYQPADLEAFIEMNRRHSTAG